MKIKYIRCSTSIQNTDRQETNSNEFDQVFIDYVSGSVPFFEREKGKLILELLNEGKLTSVTVQSIDRLGRNLYSTLETIKRFHESTVPVPVIIENLGITTLDSKTKKMDYTINLMISVMAIFSELERDILKERIREGIEVAKLKGKYKGRRSNTKESISKFLNKPMNKRALELIESDNKMSQKEIARACNLHFNTVAKIARIHRNF